MTPPTILLELEKVREALEKAESYTRQNIENHNAILKDADPESRFYGEDIVSPPVLSSITSALSSLNALIGEKK